MCGRNPGLGLHNLSPDGWFGGEVMSCVAGIKKVSTQLTES